jgi:hypothetical protein
MRPFELACELRAVQDALVDIVRRGYRERTLWVDGHPVGEYRWLTNRGRVLSCAQRERRVARC